MVEAGAELAAGVTMTVPERAAPRSLELEPSRAEASLESADRLGLARIGAGAFTPADTDVFGRVRPDVVIGRISDGIPSLSPRSAIRAEGSDGAPPRRVGGAVLEYRLAYLGHPRAGDRFEIRTGLAAVDSRTRRLIHWMLDPATGAPWASAEAVAVALDLEARRIVDLDPAALARLRGECVADLRF